MKVGIVVGINTDAISEDRFPKWLEDIDDKTYNLSKEKWGPGEYGLGLGYRDCLLCQKTF